MERVRDELTLQNFTLKQQLNDLKKHINTVNQVPYYTIHILILFQKCFGKKDFETVVDIIISFYYLTSFGFYKTNEQVSNIET